MAHSVLVSIPYSPCFLSPLLSKPFYYALWRPHYKVKNNLSYIINHFPEGFLLICWSRNQLLSRAPLLPAVSGWSCLVSQSWEAQDRERSAFSKLLVASLKSFSILESKPHLLWSICHLGVYWSGETQLFIFFVPTYRSLSKNKHYLSMWTGASATPTLQHAPQLIQPTLVRSLSFSLCLLQPHFKNLPDWLTC